MAMVPALAPSFTSSDPERTCRSRCGNGISMPRFRSSSSSAHSAADQGEAGEVETDIVEADDRANDPYETPDDAGDRIDAGARRRPRNMRETAEQSWRVSFWVQGRFLRRAGTPLAQSKNGYSTAAS